MAEIIRVSTMRHGYAEIARMICDGARVAPRGVVTHEIRDVIIECASPYDALPVGIGREVSPVVAAVEALQLIGGFSDPDLLLAASPRFRDFMDDDHFHGAYGSRIGAQLPLMIEKLLTDRVTRQAVITLWNPALDNLPGFHDYPCTIALTFLIRNGQLHMSVLMRSSDVWLGLPYDAFQFTQLQLSVCNVLHISPGSYTHHAVSMHIYETDIPSVKNLRKPDSAAVSQLDGIGTIHFDVREVMRNAKMISQERKPSDMTWTEQWYLEQVRRARERR